jgi:hypothetical protein
MKEMKGLKEKHGRVSGMRKQKDRGLKGKKTAGKTAMKIAGRMAGKHGKQDYKKVSDSGQNRGVRGFTGLFLPVVTVICAILLLHLFQPKKSGNYLYYQQYKHV